MEISQEHSPLIGRLIEMVRDSSAETAARWGRAADDAQKYASSRMLLLDRHWTFDLVLSDAGHVLVVPTESAAPMRAAGELEEQCGLYAAIRAYPELACLLPARPKDALHCHSCDGAGVIGAGAADRLKQPRCICGGAGWLPRNYEAQLPIGESW